MLYRDIVGRGHMGGMSQLCVFMRTLRPAHLYSPTVVSVLVLHNEANPCPSKMRCFPMGKKDGNGKIEGGGSQPLVVVFVDSRAAIRVD